MSTVIFEGVTQVYSPGTPFEARALSGISLEMSAGESHAFIGPSGSGKSTLLYIAGALLKPTSGKCYIGGENVGDLSDGKMARLRSEKIGFVMQDFALLDDRNVLRNVTAPLLVGRKKIGRKEMMRRAEAVLNRVNMLEYIDRPVTKLSGGQRQRVAIARAMVNDPEILIADEPTGQLDQATAREIALELVRVSSRGAIVMVATHDTELAAVFGLRHHLRDGHIDM